MSDLHPAAIGPQPDHSGYAVSQAGLLTNEQSARRTYLRELRHPLLPNEKDELDTLDSFAAGGYGPGPLVAVPTVNNQSLVAMHGILGEVLGVLHQLASQVPTGGILVAQLDALRTRFAAVFGPPKP